MNRFGRVIVRGVTDSVKIFFGVFLTGYERKGGHFAVEMAKMGLKGKKLPMSGTSAILLFLISCEMV